MPQATHFPFDQVGITPQWHHIIGNISNVTCQSAAWGADCPGAISLTHWPLEDVDVIINFVAHIKDRYLLISRIDILSISWKIGQLLLEQISVKFVSKCNIFLQENQFEKWSAKWWPFCFWLSLLTHWDLVIHICVCEWSIYEWGNGMMLVCSWSLNLIKLMPSYCQFDPSEIYFSVNVEIQTFLFKEVNLKITSVKVIPFAQASMCSIMLSYPLDLYCKSSWV